MLFRSEIQRYLLENLVSTARVAGYAYFDPETGFNENHVGWLQSVTISIDQAEDSFSPAIGGDYMRVTEFISYLNPASPATPRAC